MHRDEDRVEEALMVGGEDRPTAAGDVAHAVDLQVEEEGHADADPGLEDPPEQRALHAPRPAGVVFVEVDEEDGDDDDPRAAFTRWTIWSTTSSRDSSVVSMTSASLGIESGPTARLASR